MKKRITAILLTLALSASLLVTASASDITFSDVPTGYWGYKNIMRMTDDGLFKGTSEPVNGVGTFMPEKTMTRAEFVTAVLRAVYPEQAANVQNVAGKWWLGYYHLALRFSLLYTGELDNGAMDQPMSRQEMAMVLVRALKILKESPEQLVDESQIADYASIDAYYKTFVRECFSMGLIAGVDKQGTFAPTKSLTRAEAATVLCRLLYEDERAEVEFEDTKETTTSSGSSSSGGSSGNSGSNTGSSNNNNNGSNSSSGNNNNNSGNSGNNNNNNEENTSPVDNFRETTWEAYVDMTEDERDEFRGKFDNEDDFKAWLDRVQEDAEIEEDEDPFEGKDLSDFTWRDYMKLDLLDAAAFREKFFGGDDAAFEAWADRYIDEPDIGDDDQFGGMDLNDFTFDDYFAMDSVDQAAFCEQFFGGDDEALFDWLDSQIEEPEL